jgi:hypothetical protein
MKVPRLRPCPKIKFPKKPASVFVFDLDISDEDLQKIIEALSRKPR